MKSFTHIEETPIILWEDDFYLACLKPSNLLVHRTNFNYGERASLRDYLREQLGKTYAPLHRLDKPTSGVVLFAKHQDAFKFVHAQFAQHEVQKAYIAIVRGHVLAGGVVLKPLIGSKGGEAKPAKTTYSPLATSELDIPVSRYSTARYSLLNIQPHTGRYHQIRMHFAHLRHPVIGDRKHGDVKHNSMWEREFGVRYMFLHAHQLTFRHPEGYMKTITAPFPHIWHEAAEALSWDGHPLFRSK